MPASPSSSSRKQATRERIVDTAAREFRRHGFDGIGVADLMRAAGLTHGGFYAHFDSKDALIAEAADLAAAETLEALYQEADRHAGKDPLEGLLQSYLSPLHLAATERGCPFAALGGELARQGPRTRAAASRRIEQHVARLEQRLEGTPEHKRKRALGILATLVGAMTLARILDERKAGEQMLRAAADFIRSA